MKLTTPAPTHAEGLELLARYARDELRCRVVLTEPKADRVDECPDIIAWSTAPGFSYVLDWKCSESDALAHMRKPFVARPFEGMGAMRLIAFERHVVEPAKLDLEHHGWGAMELRDGNLHVVVEPRIFRPTERAYLHETALLVATVGNYQIETRKQPAEVRAGAKSKLPTRQLEAIKRFLADHPHTCAKILRREAGITDKPAKKLADILERTPGIETQTQMGERVFNVKEG